MTNTSASLKRRKGQSKEQPKGKKVDQPVDGKENEVPQSKFEPLPPIPKQRVWTRIVVVLCTLVVVYFTSNQEKTVNLAKVKESVNNRRQDLKCAQDYLEEVSDLGCAPSSCGRIVMDHVVTSEEVEGLLSLFQKALALGGGAGGASIFDLHSGALSKADKFVDIYSVPNFSEIFSLDDFAVYLRVKRKIQEVLAAQFRVESEKLYLTKPTMFSRLTFAEPLGIHDEYWHPHVDKDQYKSFHYTSMVYLSNYDADFKGGRFIFDDPNNVSTIVEPKRGRLSVFTSGAENLHRVERVESGSRFAILISFTCEKKHAIADPSFKPRRRRP